MITAQDRITELTTRQIYYGSSLVVKLNAVNGKFDYKVYGWLSQDKVDVRFPIIKGKYNGEDPDTLIQMALFELQAKKIKLGVIQHVQ